MKKKITNCLLFLSVSLIVSCSGDGNEPNVVQKELEPNDPVLEDYHLVKKVSNLINDEGLNYGSIESIIEDDKLMSIVYKDESGTITNEEKFSYNEKGILYKQSVYEGSELQRSKEVIHDDQNRIIEMRFIFPKFLGNNNYVKYSYEVDGQITASHDLGNGHSFDQVFILKNGYVIEELDSAGEYMTKIEFTDNNITYMADQVGEIFYSYKAIGANPMQFYVGLFGEHKFNMVLFHELLQDVADYYSNGLVKEKHYRDAAFKEINVYTTNEVGLPLTCKTSYEEGGVTKLARDITFEYKMDQ